ncbi:MAG: endonuclease/exonuclease/phosphatase family protein [Paludibacter sp.]|nr:endonuclease/exonuclease/phosphatase family protein [Paludibacter sp.]
MKKWFFNLIFLFFTFNILSCKIPIQDAGFINSTSDTLRIATYNVRIKTSGDIDKRAWDERKPFVAQLINSNRFDVFGVQELVNQKQENDLKVLLPSFNFFSKGRDDTQGTSGERLTIFYNKNRFNELDNGFFFLSETPEIASKGWDAALNRICVWVKLYDKVNKKTYFFFNVHFDHIGTTARAQSAALVVKKMNEIARDETTFCVGDFNASPYETAVYKTMTAKYTDGKIVYNSETSGSMGTFNGWDVSKDKFPENVRIDYIFTAKVRILAYKVLTDKYVPETYPSDHFPVMMLCLME